MLKYGEAVRKRRSFFWGAIGDSGHENGQVKVLQVRGIADNLNVADLPALHAEPPRVAAAHREPAIALRKLRR